MKIRCKCGRTLLVSLEKHAGKKVACKACGQRYRLPEAKPKDPSVQLTAWKDDEELHDPQEVGAAVLGERLSIRWLLISMVAMVAIAVGGAVGIKEGLHALASTEGLEDAADLAFLAVLWAPMLAFVVAGWVVARLSPGKTITEPALGAAIAVAALLSLAIAQPGPIEGYLAGLDLPDVGEVGPAIKGNLFAIAMFSAACFACAGAYFGEVAQERAAV